MHTYIRMYGKMSMDLQTSSKEIRYRDHSMYITYRNAGSLATFVELLNAVSTIVPPFRGQNNSCLFLSW